jgi:hypothetical protein
MPRKPYRRPESDAIGKTNGEKIHRIYGAFVYNVIDIPIAAGILYAFSGFLLHPTIAGATMAFRSLSTVSNSLGLIIDSSSADQAVLKKYTINNIKIKNENKTV